DTTPPTVPQGLTATAQSATQIALAWTASTDDGAGGAGYRVFRDAGGATPPPNDSRAPPPASAPTHPEPPQSGLDSRPSNTSCLAGDAPDSTVSLATQRVFASLPGFSPPLAMLPEPG